MISIDSQQLYHHQFGEKRKIQLYYDSYPTHHCTGTYKIHCTRRTIMIATYGRYNITHTNTSRSYITINHSNRRRRNTMIRIIIILSYRRPVQYIVHCTRHAIYIYMAIYMHITTRQQEYSIMTNKLYYNKIIHNATILGFGE